MSREHRISLEELHTLGEKLFQTGTLTYLDAKPPPLHLFVTFFSRPEEINYALMPVSVGNAHMIALEYFNIGEYELAKVSNRASVSHVVHVLVFYLMA